MKREKIHKLLVELFVKLFEIKMAQLDRYQKIVHYKLSREFVYTWNNLFSL